ncbi:hypothetical protein DL96DRAFT_611863 [Flagelloscypha sp. PMI_526]|nr:hypothetical protein DL96DRAFT_611863 [Flagelloscypha sp. PMI_526]
MIVSPGEIVGGIRFVIGVVDKVKDNKEDLRRLSTRLEHVMLSLEESRRRDVLKPTEYEDALTAIAALVERAQRATKKVLQRSLGDRTWRRDEIANEVKRIIADVDAYLSSHIIRTLDAMYLSNTQSLNTLSASVEELMIKLAEVDLRLRNPSSEWPTNIQSAARDEASEPSPPELTPLVNPPMDGDSLSLDLARNLSSNARAALQIANLKTIGGESIEEPVVISNIPVNARFVDVAQAIKGAGYRIPDDLLIESVIMKVTDADDCYDARQAGGLKISRGTPLLSWWNKYNRYNSIRVRGGQNLTPGLTLARLDGVNSKGYASSIMAGNVKIQFHRTLRVPDDLDVNRLPVDLGIFPLLPVAKYAHKLPENIVQSGGFFMPMFEREALFISFQSLAERGFFESMSPAVKISAGGVNILTGKFKNVYDAHVCEQDYIVAGRQPWIDGAMTEEGIVRQFVGMNHDNMYTLEEQVTGKADEGGFQFDVFPRIQKNDLENFIEYNMEYETKNGRCSQGRRLDYAKTPREAGVMPGATIGTETGAPFICKDDAWTVSEYLTSIGDLPLTAEYNRTDLFGDSYQSYVCGIPVPITSEAVESVGGIDEKIRPMGIGLGGKIIQKIYKDKESPRVYDQEGGQRVYVHIISTDVWERVTGTLPPITPISPETYKQHKIPWFTLSDTSETSLYPQTAILSHIKTINQVDREKANARSLEITQEAIIDPEKPPKCLLHSKLTAEVVFRPCGHTACSGCLGKAMLQRSTCPACSMRIIRYVGIQEPVADISEDGVQEGANGIGGFGAWNVLIDQIEKSEALSKAAVRGGKVVVLHLQKDRVSPLYSNNLPVILEPADDVSILANRGGQTASTAPPKPSLMVAKKATTDAPQRMIIFINAPSSKCRLDILPTDTVQTMKEMIAEKIGIAPEDQRPLYHGRIMGMRSDQETLADYGVKKELTIQLIARMRRQ